MSSTPLRSRRPEEGGVNNQGREGSGWGTCWRGRCCCSDYGCSCCRGYPNLKIDRTPAQYRSRPRKTFEFQGKSDAETPIIFFHLVGCYFYGGLLFAKEG